ncbi:MAG: tetratricopeptide repeat protein [Promethearchaeota archaeon]|nr:MAG: tetratricopeptide repeat protein [Candidatus Lokiarchaeota archaeon]
MSKSNDLIYPPQNILQPSIIEKNYELIILWMLRNNDSCGWSDFTDYMDDQLIPESTLSNYLRTLKRQGYIEKPERNKYEITSEGKIRLNELLYLKETGGSALNYPPKIITKSRNYDHWILWMLYNNDSCRWSDFTSDPLNINQSSLSKNIKRLTDEDLIRNENKEYIITPLGKSEYFKVLKDYELDRQSILEEESKRIQEFTNFSNEFFDKYEIDDDGIKFRFLSNVLKLNYSKVENLLEEEETFNKILLFLSINHPDQYPDYVSPERFAHEYNLKKTTLDFFIEKIVEEEFYDTKFFKLEVAPNKIFYLQAGEKIEKVLRAIVDDYMTRYTYLNNLYRNIPKNGPELTISNIIEQIVNEICSNLFHEELKDVLRKFLPEYIKDLAYTIETEKKLISDDNKLENLIWQTISDEFESLSTLLANREEDTGEVIYGLDHNMFEALDIYYLYKLDYIENNELKEEIRPINQEIFNQIFVELRKGDLSRAEIMYNENKSQFDENECLIIEDLISTSSGKFNKSLRLTENLIETNPESYIGYLLNAITLFKMDRLNDCIDILSEGFKRTSNKLLKIQKAQALIKMDEVKEALALIEEELTNFPNDFLLLRTKFLAMLCEKGVYYGHPDKYIEFANSILKLKPENKEILILKAMILAIAKRVKDAEKVIREDINFVINPYEENPTIDTSLAYISVYLNLTKGLYIDALKVANHCLVSYPNNPISYITKAFIIGYALIFDWEISEANVDNFKGLIDKAMHYEPIMFNQAIYIQFKAYILRELGNSEEAYDVIEEAIELYNKDFDFYRTKIFFLLSNGRDNEALKLLDSIINDFPKRKISINKLKSFIYFKIQDFNQGLKVIDEVIEEAPNEKHLHNNKALILAKLNREEEAIESIKKLIEIDPQDGNSYDTYGEILMEFGRYEDALEKLEEAERLDPNGWYICHTYQKMANCYEKLGLPNKARECGEKLNSAEKRRGVFYKEIYEKKSSNQSNY